MKKIIIILLYLCSTFVSNHMYAQTTQENLEKYWLYRDRLRKHFIVISPHDEFGTNIPFFYHSYEGDNRKGLTIGDGNDGLQYYIGMLATEYALLQKYTMDVTQTRNELLYALKAVERLDKFAECQFRQLPNIRNSGDGTGTNTNNYYSQIPNTNQYQEGDLNGFFIRDDIGKDFIERYPYLKSYGEVRSTFVMGHGRNMPYEESKDNVWNYLPNLALVYVLVDDPIIQQKVKDITFRMIKHMHYNMTNRVYYPCGLFSDCFPGEWRTMTTPTWRIMNPVTGFMAVDGAAVEEILIGNGNLDGFNYGFAEAGNFIIKNSEYPNLHFGASQEIGRENWFYFYNGFAGIWSSRTPHSSLATVGGNNTIYSNYAAGTIMHALLATLFVDIGKSPSKLEHLPLIRKLIVEYQMKKGMYDNYEDLQVFNEYKSSKNLLSFYENLLNEAPICGPVNYGPDKYRVINWSVDNRLTNSGQIKELNPKPDGSDPYRVKIDNAWNNGVYNGIDYMLLHNLYWLCFAPPSEPYTVNCTNYFPNIHTRKIVSNCTIPADKTITYTASESISLQPGFSAQKGSTFKAEINTQWRYQYTNPAELISSNNCYSGIPYSLQKSESITSEIYNEISPYTYPSEIVDLPLYAIMPNPNTGSFTIKNIQQKNFNIQIYSMSGVLLTQHQSYGNDIPISIEQKGIFQLQITSENKVYTEQIICK